MAGALPALIVKVALPELPQPLFAVTLIVPPVAPAMACMLSTVDVPVQPLGKVHV